MAEKINNSQEIILDVLICKNWELQKNFWNSFTNIFLSIRRSSSNF